MYSAKILADSLAPCGKRLTTYLLTYPRMVHSELMTHRMISRNSASSRAIPNEKLRAAVKEDPVMPFWGANQKGMQAAEELCGAAKERAVELWLEARRDALDWSERLAKVGVHKQICNRIIEPWMWITVIASATDWANFFHLRCSPMAQPEIKEIAEMMRELYRAHQPEILEEGEWHLPLIGLDDHDTLSEEDLKKVSVGRCARVSYLTHDGKRDPQADIDLHDRLVTSGHWSPFEHVAQAMDRPERSGNFIGWAQYRKEFEGENVEG